MWYKSGQATLGHRYSTARVSKRQTHQSAACLRARYYTDLAWLDLDLSSAAMAPILRGALLRGESERVLFAFFTLVSYIGPHAPYRQTERGDSNKPYLEKLLADNKAYWRFCSAETLEEGRKKTESEEKTPRYAGTSRAKTSAETARRVSLGEKVSCAFPPKTLM